MAKPTLTGLAVIAEQLGRLREEWHDQANGIERTYGDDAPAARAFRACISDLYAIQTEAQARLMRLREDGGG